jgi:hypothetical protein
LLSRRPARRLRPAEIERARGALHPSKMRIRPVLAITCCLIGAGPMLLEAHDARHSDAPLFVGMAAVAIIAAALLALRPLWTALAGRGLLWTVLALATLADSASRPMWTFTTTALAMCAALLVLGRHTLDRQAAAFQPSHHRGPLTLALVLGFADVATLTGWSIVAFADGGGRAVLFGAVFTGFAVAIAASLVGLYRLRAWGFLLNLAVNLAVVVLMMLDVLHLDIFRLVFIVPAVAQILLALPVLLAILLRRPLTVPRPLARLGALVPVLTLLVMAGLNVQAWFGEPALRQLVRWGMRQF